MTRKDKSESMLPLKINGREIPLRWILVVAGLLGLGGGGGSIFMTSDQVEKKIETKTAEMKAVEDERHVKIDKTFKKITKTINQVQDVQHSQVARQEARRITVDIEDRADREKSYDRLLGMNKRRLKRGSEPCANIDCTN